MTAWGLAAACGVLICACDLPNALGGSISYDVSLEFQDIDIAIADRSLRIDYLRVEPLFGVAVTCRVTVDTTAPGLGPGVTVSGEDFLRYVEISRRAVTGGDFPDVVAGTLTFAEYGAEAGALVSGTFEATFVGDRDIAGRFTGRLREIPQP